MSNGDGDKTVVVREIKLTINFVTAEPFFDPNFDYNGKVDEWIKEYITDELNGQFPAPRIHPALSALIKSEDIT